MIARNARNAFNEALLNPKIFGSLGSIGPVTDFTPQAQRSLPARLGGSAPAGGGYGSENEAIIRAASAYHRTLDRQTIPARDPSSAFERALSDVDDIWPRPGGRTPDPKYASKEDALGDGEQWWPPSDVLSRPPKGTMHLLQPSKEETRTLKGEPSKEEMRGRNATQPSKEEFRTSKEEASKEERANSQHAPNGDDANQPPKGEKPSGSSGGRVPMQGDWE